VAVLAGCTVAAAAGAALGGVPGVASAAVNASASTTALVPGPADPAVHGGASVGAVPASQRLTVQVWLEPHLAAAATFADAVATPGSAEFHHYLSPDAYTARFGSAVAQATAVADWLTARGMTQVRADRGRDYVSATGPASAVESAFQVRINKYRVTSPNGRPMVIQANDRAVSMPASLLADVAGITGLDSAPPLTSQTRTRAKTPSCSHYWAQYSRTFHPAYQKLAKGALPVCGYSASQIRAAYGVTMSSAGKGQTVALIEDEAPIAMARTLTEYAKSNHLPAPAPGQFRQVRAVGKSTCGGSSQDAAQLPYSDEAQMDSEAVYAMAPGASQLMVIGEGCDENQALLDAALSVLAGNGGHPSASIESNSWQIPLGEVPAQTVHAIDLRAAAEGVGMYFAAGDTPGLTATDADPYVTAVGGTTLGIGAKDNRVFETGWSDDYVYMDNGKWSDAGISGGTGGGTSLVYGQPAYQKGIVPASMSSVRAGKKTVTDRTVPDIAADADSDSGILTGYIASGTDSHPGPYRTEENAGTSLACPLIAGLVADAQQGQKSAFGFVNPLIYHLARTPAFHDILSVTTAMPQQDRAAYTPASGTTSAGLDVFDSRERAYTDQVTAKGYDTMTGIGTPNGGAMPAQGNIPLSCGNGRLWRSPEAALHRELAEELGAQWRCWRRRCSCAVPGQLRAWTCSISSWLVCWRWTRAVATAPSSPIPRAAAMPPTGLIRWTAGARAPSARAPADAPARLLEELVLIDVFQRLGPWRLLGNPQLEKLHERIRQVQRLGCRARQPAQSPGQPDVAARVHRAEVAGVEPAVPVDGHGRRPRVVEVAEHDLVAADPDLADRPARRGRPGPAFDDLELRAGQRPADAAEPVGQRVGRCRRGEQAGGFGLRERGQDRNAEQCFRVAREIRGDPRAAAHHRAQRAEIALRQRRVAEHPGQHPRGGAQQRAAVLLDQREVRRGIEPWQQHVGPGELREPQGHQPAAPDMRQRQRVDDRVTISDAQRGRRQARVVGQRAMGEDDPLGAARRPRRVQDLRRAVGGHFRQRGRLVRPAERSDRAHGVPVAQRKHATQQRQPVWPGTDGAGSPRFSHVRSEKKAPCTRVGQHVGNLISAGRRL
jgi:hypothetical protein